MVCKRKRKKRKKQKKKKRNKERKVVEKEDKISEKEDEQREETTVDLVLPKCSSALISLVGGMPRMYKTLGMQLHDQTEVGEMLQLRSSVYLRRLIEGPAIPTRADIYLHQKFRLLGVYRRAGEILLAVRKEESGKFEVDRERRVSRDTRATLIGKTQQFAEIAFDDYACHDPECPLNNSLGNFCTDSGLKRCDGWVRWKYLMPDTVMARYKQGQEKQTSSKQGKEGWSREGWTREGP